MKIAGMAMAGMLLAGPAFAQMDSRDAISLQNQILELRQQMQQLQRGGPAPQTYRPDRNAPAGGDSGSLTGQLLDRVATLEDQVRTLRGQVEQLSNKQDRQSADFTKQLGDLSFSLQNGAGQPASPPPSRAPAQSPPPSSLGSLPSGGPPPGTPPPRTPELAMQEASAALARRDYPAAEAAAREVIAKRGPRATDAQFLLAMAEMGQRSYQQAAPDFYDAYNRNRTGPRAQDSLLGVADSLVALGDKSSACDALAKLRAEFPQPRPEIRDASNATAPAPAAADASPVTDDEFATAMAPLGPWDAERRVAVAVSGGPDSLALALLTQAWGRPVALIVDHGLRPEAASEAAATRAALSSRGIHACILRLHLQPGPAVAARARAARYEALTAACRSAGLVDLLLGHHAADQAETVLMRQRRGSGPAGLAGMAALAERHDIRLVRPLLGFEPSRLRDTVRRAGLTPVEDPTNTDLRTTRARLRQEIGGKLDSLLAEAVAAGRHRTLQEAAAARELAACAALYPERFAVLSADRINEASLAALLRSLSGKGLPVSHAGKLAGQLRATTIAGIQLAPAGRLGPGWLLVREASAMAPPMPALADTVWDGRFRVVRAPGGHSIGASGRQASRCRARERLPSAVLRALPALSADGLSGWEPIANIRSSGASETDSVVHQAGLPVAGAPFLACS